MVNVRKIASLFFTVVAVLLITGCAQYGSDPPPVPNLPDASIDRGTFVNMPNSISGTDISAIIDFIPDYNTNQAENLQLDGYKVEEFDKNGAYIVKGEAYDIIVQLNENNKILFAYCSDEADPATRQSVAEAIMVTLWPQDLTSEEFRSDMALRELKNWAGMEELLQDIDGFENGGSGFSNSGLPEPSVSLPGSEQAVPEMFDEGQLKEPTVSKPVNPNIKAEDLPSIGNFGKVPERDIG